VLVGKSQMVGDEQVHELFESIHSWVGMPVLLGAFHRPSMAKTLLRQYLSGAPGRKTATPGTDHGHANLMLVLGGPVRGGKVYGKWPGLEQEQLYEGRDLAVTTDFREVLGELVSGHLGQKNLSLVFPGYKLRAAGSTAHVAYGGRFPLHRSLHVIKTRGRMPHLANPGNGAVL
jgi:hypothetical protein